MDLFGRERARLRKELEAVSGRAVERQGKVEELERIIEDLKGEVARRRALGASSTSVSEAQKALDDAVATHGRSTR